MDENAGKPDFSVFMEVRPEESNYLSFYDFCKIFFLGDLSEVFNLSTFGYAKTLADDLDPGQSTPENRLRYMGDPVKQAMLVQILRHFPHLAPVPVIISLALVIASFAKFTIPFIRRFAALISALSTPQRKKREIEGGIDGIMSIPDHLKNLTSTLSSALDGVEYLAELESQKSGLYSVPKKRSTKFANYDERKARASISKVTEVGKVVRSWIKTWIDVTPIISNCLGQVIGCLVRLSYWNSNCKIFGPATACIGALGRAIEVVVTTSFQFLDD